MFFVSIICLSILIPSIRSLTPTLKLTFTPDKKYYSSGDMVMITCELVNPDDPLDIPHLWHVDYKTGKHTVISRSVLYSPTDDAPDVFKQNTVKRIEYIKRNHIRIRQLYLDDTARYDCSCPDCEEKLTKASKKLEVMKLSEPKWHIEPSWPILEHAKTTIKCTVDDFYPYVAYKIIRSHHDISNEGKTVIPNSNTYPQDFSWEATVTPTADWHNTTSLCVVFQGETEHYAKKTLEVLFTPRFLKCDMVQHVDSTKEKETIECSYAGNPPPKLTWLHQTDEKPLTSDVGITIKTKDLQHGRYRSIITFDREKLIASPLITTTNFSDRQSKLTGDNYYQQLLHDGFIVKLTYHNNEGRSRKITIIDIANQIRSEILPNSSTKTIQNLSQSIILCYFLSFYV